MSVSAISSNVAPSMSAVQNPLAQQRANFQALAKALQSNDLAGARTAFAVLQQSTSSTRPTQASDFQALARALQAGDLGGAQTTFARLQHNAQKIQGHHHHHHAGAVSSIGTSTRPSAAASSAAASAIGSTIDIRM